MFECCEIMWEKNTKKMMESTKRFCPISLYKDKERLRKLNCLNWTAEIIDSSINSIDNK